MNCSIAIYPNSHFREQLPKWESYIQSSRKYGFTEIFSTMHMPEFSVEQQLEVLKELSKLAAAYHMELTMDIGGSEISEILEHPELNQEVGKAGIHFVRLDYGYSPEQEKRMLESWGLKGFVINASIYSREEFTAIKRRIKSLGPEVEIRACHNYYPRPESGLDRAFFRRQNLILEELNIPVYSCIPSHTNPRLPLYQGLPTLEHHRYMPVEQVACELVNSRGNQGIMAADEFFTEEELSTIRNVVKKEALKLHITWLPGVTPEEKDIVEKQIHHIRYDSNCWVLRSQSSREMSQFAAMIQPRDTGIRTPGMVTIDNSHYNRYSGELQIVLQELPEDQRVNLVALIEPEDMWKLDFYRDGYNFRMTEKR